MKLLDTNRWTGVGALTLLAAGVAIVLGRQPGLLLVGVVGVAYAAYARSDEAPLPSLTVERELADETAGPGDEVRVVVTVTNTGDSTLFDLRLVDGVPRALAVADGSPRLGTALRPGKRAQFSYAVTAVRGEHDWEPMQVIARNASGSRERVTEVETETTLRCLPELRTAANLPLRGLTTQYAGQLATEVGGPGLEYHSTREYRHGDPLNRVDWYRRARTGDLATLDFREERAATVVLLIDARDQAYVASRAGAPNAVERSVDAAGQVFSALVGGGDRVGVAAFGAEECWLAPGSGRDHQARARTLLATHPALSPIPSGGKFFPSIRFRRLLRRLPSDAQVLFFSPVTDEYAVSVARRLDAYGHAVTVVSPDPTASDTLGHRLAAVERRTRLSTLRRAGLRAVDWPDEPLATVLTRMSGRWSQ